MRRTLAAMCLIATAMPAAAQSAAPTAPQASPFTPVKATAGKAWRHRHSRITLPATLEGMARSGVKQLGSDELDVIGEYHRGDDAISIYVFRNVAGTVPVWFDRARHAIEHRPAAYGTPTLAVPVAAFIPPRQSVASGLSAAWTPSAGGYRGTALALLPIDGWWVKVRYSATAMDAAAVHAQLPAVLAALGWPNAIPAQPAAAEVRPCADRIATSGDARRIEDADAAMRGIILSSFVGTLRGTPEADFCRDETPVPVGAVYRPAAAPDRYMIALGDSGRALWAGRDALGALLDDGKPDAWTVSLVDMGRTGSLPPLDRLPPPTQALALLNTMPMASSTNSWGKRRTVNVNSGMLPQ